jgi:hypothetical protein
VLISFAGTGFPALARDFLTLQGNTLALLVNHRRVKLCGWTGGVGLATQGFPLSVWGEYGWFTQPGHYCEITRVLVHRSSMPTNPRV